VRYLGIAAGRLSTPPPENYSMIRRSSLLGLLNTRDLLTSKKRQIAEAHLEEEERQVSTLLYHLSTTLTKNVTGKTKSPRASYQEEGAPYHKSHHCYNGDRYRPIVERSLMMRRFQRYLDGPGKPTEELPDQAAALYLANLIKSAQTVTNTHMSPSESRNKATLAKPRIEVSGNYSRLLQQCQD
jgi:hypothetical protein